MIWVYRNEIRMCAYCSCLLLLNTSEHDLCCDIDHSLFLFICWEPLLFMVYQNLFIHPAVSITEKSEWGMYFCVLRISSDWQQQLKMFCTQEKQCPTQFLTSAWPQEMSHGLMGLSYQGIKSSYNLCRADHGVWEYLPLFQTQGLLLHST